jgi:hypothetical protein
MDKTRLAVWINRSTRQLKLLGVPCALTLALIFPIAALAQNATAPKKPVQPTSGQKQTANQQDASKTAPLTNADVIQMTEAGIQPQIIKTAIRQAGSRKFDLTSKGLIELKQHKVPDDVAAAMQDPSAPDAAALSVSAQQPTPEPQAPANSAEPTGLPKEQGIFYKGVSGWVPLQEVQSSGAKTTGMGKALLTGGWGGSGDVVMVFPGAEAPVQISESKPTFYSRPPIQSPRDLMIVRVDKKKDHRELQTTTGAVFKSAGYKKSNVVEVSTTLLSSDVMVITPATDLKDGEYLLVFSYGGSGGYDFSINQKKK